MPLGEEQALDFLVGLNTKTFETGTQKVTGGLAQIAAMAEEAHKAAVKDRKSFLERFLPDKFAQMGPRKLAAIGVAARMASKALSVAHTVVSEGVEAWKQNYLGMLDWRREMNLTHDDVLELQGAVLGATSRYGFAIDKAATAMKILAQGSEDAKDSLGGVAVGVAELERYTGAPVDLLANFQRLIAYSMKAVEKGAGFDQFILRLGEGLAGSKVSTEEFVGQMMSLESFFRDFSRRKGGQEGLTKDILPRLIEQLASLRVGWAKAGRSAQSFDTVMSQLVMESGGMWMFLDRNRPDLFNFMDKMADLFERLGTGTGALQLIAKQYGITTEAAGDLVDVWREHQDIVRGSMAMIDQVRDLNKDALFERRYQRASPLEKVRMSWEDITRSVASVAHDTNTILQPFLEYAADKLRAVSTYTRDFAKDIGDVARTMQEYPEQFTAKDVLYSTPFGLKLLEMEKQWNSWKSFFGMGPDTAPSVPPALRPTGAPSGAGTVPAPRAAPGTMEVPKSMKKAKPKPEMAPPLSPYPLPPIETGAAVPVLERIESYLEEMNNREKRLDNRYSPAAMGSNALATRFDLAALGIA